MDIINLLKNTFSILINGLSINFDRTITKDLFNTLVFCIIFTFLVIGSPYVNFNGLPEWFFKAIYSQYSEMDITRQLYYERLILSQLKISLLLSTPIFIVSMLWILVFYKVDLKSYYPNNVIVTHFFLFINRWVFASQFLGISLVPFLSIKILDLSYQTMQTGTPIHQLPWGMIKSEMLCLLITVLSFLLLFFHQTKKLLDFVQAVPRKWFDTVKQKFSFAAIIPILLGIIVSSYYSNFMKTDNILNNKVFLNNQCIYMMQNSNIPGHNALKATLEEIGCKKYTTCDSMTDERLKSNCFAKLYTHSENFVFLAHNEKKDICRS